MKKSHHIDCGKKGRISQLMSWDNWPSICGKKQGRDVHFFPKRKINFKWYKMVNTKLKGKRGKEGKRKGRGRKR